MPEDVLKRDAKDFIDAADKYSISYLKMEAAPMQRTVHFSRRQ